MAGRGCSVTVQIIRQEEAEIRTDEILLPVALHSPLEVLKEMLQNISGIDVVDQVLILCDLSDPDRNRDVHLDNSMNENTLFRCGIQQGSVLALHALGVESHNVQRFKDLAETNAITQSVRDCRPLKALVTRVTPSQANHSYNGIIFSICSKSPFEVDIFSVSVGGMLGRVRVFFKYGSWEASDDPDDNGPKPWWGASERVSRSGWVLAADKICAPSWDRPFEIPLNKSFHLLPGQLASIYIHSGLPDDLGIQYQSYPKNAIVAEDDHIQLLPGLGHTGSRPFDEQSGWYRAYRGLAGVIGYRCNRKGWNIWSHKQFPKYYQDCIKTMLLCREHSLNLLDKRKSVLLYNMTLTPEQRRVQLGLLHTHILYYIMEFMDWEWFPEVVSNNEDMEDEDEEVIAGVSARSLRQMLAGTGQTLSRASRSVTETARMAIIRYLMGTGQISGVQTLDHDDEADHYVDESMEEEDDDDSEYMDVEEGEGDEEEGDCEDSHEEDIDNGEDQNGRESHEEGMYSASEGDVSEDS